MLSSVAFSISWGGGEERKEGREGDGDAFMEESQGNPESQGWVGGEGLRTFSC